MTGLYLSMTELHWQITFLILLPLLSAQMPLHFIYGYKASVVKDHSDNERGNLLPPHGLAFPISSKGSFICTIPQTG